MIKYNSNIKDKVTCKYCIHRPIGTIENEFDHELEFPDNVCPCRCEDNWYSYIPADNFFCMYGERK